MTSITNGQFSVSWINPKNSERQKLLLLELDRALRILKVLEGAKKKHKLISRGRAKNKVVACAENLLREFAVDLAEARAEEALGLHHGQKENPLFK